MKFNLKMIAVAAAMVAASSSHAALTTATAGNSSFAMVAFNAVTNAYYVRDLGYNLNSFLPNLVTTGSGDGGVTGDKTPDAGLNLTFGGAGNFVSWLGTQNVADIRWTVLAGDAQSSSATNLSRALVALGTAPVSPIANSVITNATNAGNGVTALNTQNPGMGFDATGATVISSFLSNNGFGVSTLTNLGSTASLFYYTRAVASGSNTGPANFSAFSNSANTATLTLATNGVLTYDLQAAPSAVPVPAAAWLMLSGLGCIGGMVRRRKAAAV